MRATSPHNAYYLKYSSVTTALFQLSLPFLMHYCAITKFLYVFGYL